MAEVVGYLTPPSTYLFGVRVAQGSPKPLVWVRILGQVPIMAH